MQGGASAHSYIFERTLVLQVDSSSCSNVGRADFPTCYRVKKRQAGETPVCLEAGVALQTKFRQSCCSDVSSNSQDAGFDLTKQRPGY